MVDPDKPVVVVIEDEERLATVYSRWLSEDYAVRTAHTGEEGLSMMDASVDAVLLDRRLPGINGSAVLDEIRERGYECRVAVITAVDPDYDILDMPFDDYLVKPLLREDIVDVVSRLVELSCHDDRLQECYALASKLTALERQKPRSELERSSEYDASRDRLDGLLEAVEDSLSAFESKDFELAYRALAAGEDRSCGAGPGVR